MNKTDFIEAMSFKTGVTKKDTTKFVDCFLDTIKEELAKGEKIHFCGFGTFEVTERASRLARNPKTGETFMTDPYKAPKFKVGSALKAAVKE